MVLHSYSCKKQHGTEIITDTLVNSFELKARTKVHTLNINTQLLRNKQEMYTGEKTENNAGPIDGCM